MKMDWFVIHVLSGQENKVREALQHRLQQEEMSDYVGEVLIPTETVSEVKRGKKTTTTRKFFPGYVMMHLALYDESNNLHEQVWYFIRDIPGIIGFVGGDRPTPLRPSEVDELLNQVAEKKEKVKPKVEFEPGETVKITDGPFLNFSGVIEEVDPERGKLKMSVSIFGRAAPVELEYWQVERA